MSARLYDNIFDDIRRVQIEYQRALFIELSEVSLKLYLDFKKVQKLCLICLKNLFKIL